MNKQDLQVGDLVQINPEHIFGGMLLVITEVVNWGCEGYLMSSYNFDATRFEGKAYLRCKWNDIEFVGRMYWIDNPTKVT